MTLSDPIKELKTGRAWHIEIADDYIECLVCKHQKRLGAAETDGN